MTHSPVLIAEVRHNGLVQRAYFGELMVDGLPEWEASPWPGRGGRVRAALDLPSPSYARQF